MFILYFLFFTSQVSFKVIDKKLEVLHTVMVQHPPLFYKALFIIFFIKACAKKSS